MVSLQLFGVPTLRHGDALSTLPATRPVALLAYLARRGVWVGREEVASVLWPDADEAAARHALRQLVYRARRLEWAPTLEATDDHLRWRVEHDVASFQRCLATADWEGAVRAYRGVFLEGLTLPDAPGFAAWCDLERDELRRGYIDAALRAAAAHELHRGYALAADLLERAWPHEPWSEPLAQALIRCLALDGRPAAAVAAYERFRTTLADELGVAPSPATRDLAERARVGSRVDARPHNLPGQATPFVGRSDELRELARRLADPACRLVTLTGPGGIGKTRLALQAAAQQVGAFRHGVFVVALATVADPGRIADAVFAALGTPRPEPGVPDADLHALLHERQLLLLLDNLEQLVGAGRWIGDLITAAPGVTVLATSREPLGLAAEWLHPLDGLDLPSGDPGDPPSAAERLFVLGAERVRPDLALDPQASADVERICRLVAGVPLAIELAAGWSALLTPAEIAREIERDLGFLERPDRDAPGRHGSLRAVFDASWDRLGPTERRLALLLSPFLGDLDLATVETVAGEPVLPDLMRLSQRAFVRRGPDGRFAMHELVHQFVQERLAVEPERRGDAERRHALAVVDLVVAEADDDRRDGGVERLRRLLPDAERAWTWLRAQRDWPALARLLPRLFEFHDLQGRSRGYLAGLDATLGAAPDDAAFVAALRAQRAGCLQRLARYDEAECEVQAVLALQPDGPQAPPAFARCVALRARGNAAYQRGDLDTAEAAFAEALTLAERLGQRRYQAGCLNNLGLVHKARPDLDRAAAVLRRARALADDLDDAVRSQVLNNLAIVQSRRGATDEAEVLLRESASLKRRLGDDRGLASVATNLGNLRALAGDLVAAERYHREALALSASIGDASGVARAYKNLGDVQDQRGDLRAAIVAYERCLALKLEIDERAGAIEAYGRLAACHTRAGDLAAAREAVRAREAFALRVGWSGPLPAAAAPCVAVPRRPG